MLMLQDYPTPPFYPANMKTIPNDIFFAQVSADLSAGRSVSFKVKGNSMFPLLRNGKDIVFVSPVNQPVVKKDVVLFTHKGRHVLHRVIKIEGNAYTIQGDGVYASREYCTGEDIIGVVTHVARGGGEMVPLNGFRYRLYSNFWCATSFARKYLLYILRKFGK